MKNAHREIKQICRYHKKFQTWNLDTYTPVIILVGPEDKSSTNQENISDENMQICTFSW